MTSEDRQSEIDKEIQAHKGASDKAFKNAKKATAMFNKVMAENHFYFTLMLHTSDKRKKS